MRKLAQVRQSANTRRAYAADWAHFQGWCRGRGGDPALATPTNVAAYLAELPEEGFAYASIARASAGIMRQLAAYDRGAWLSRPPEVQEVLKNLARALGRAPKNAKQPLTLAIIERGLPRAYPGSSMRELRNRAMVLFGYYLATRRSELVAVRFVDLDTRGDPRGIGVTIPRSKTDQEGKGIHKFVFRQPEEFLCPVLELRAWVLGAGLVLDGMASGHVFRELSSAGNVLERPASEEAVAVAVKEVARAAKLDPDDFGGHSLRAGFVTDAAAQGIPLETIAHQTGHRSLEQLRKYIRRLHPSENNPTEGFAARARARLVRR